jgi:hypothetical protein
MLVIRFPAWAVVQVARTLSLKPEVEKVAAIRLAAVKGSQVPP